MDRATFLSYITSPISGAGMPYTSTEQGVWGVISKMNNEIENIRFNCTATRHITISYLYSGANPPTSTDQLFFYDGVVGGSESLPDECCLAALAKLGVALNMNQTEYLTAITGGINPASLPDTVAGQTCPLHAWCIVGKQGNMVNDIRWQESDTTYILITNLAAANPPTSMAAIKFRVNGVWGATFPKLAALASLAALPYGAAPSFTLTLQPGSNFLSLPVYEARTVTQVFGAVQVTRWDATAQNWAPVGSAVTPEPGIGYVVPADAALAVPLYGPVYTVSVDALIAGLKTGWNLVGVGATALSLANTGYTATYDAPDGTRTEGILVLEPGKAYWLEKSGGVSAQASVSLSSVPTCAALTVDGTNYPC